MNGLHRSVDFFFFALFCFVDLVITEYEIKRGAKGGLIKSWEPLRALRKIYHQRSGGLARYSVTPGLGVFNKNP